MMRSFLAFLSLVCAFHVHGARDETASMSVTENLIEDGVESTELILKRDDSDTAVQIILEVEEDETIFIIDSIGNSECGCLKYRGYSAGIPHSEGRLSIDFVDHSQFCCKTDPRQHWTASLSMEAENHDTLIMKMEGAPGADRDENLDLEIVERIPWIELD